MRRTVILGFLFAGAISSASAQWLNYRDPKTPRTKDGKPNLSAPVLHTNGKPDLSGVCQTEPTPPEEMRRLFGDLSAFAVPGDDARLYRSTY